MRRSASPPAADKEKGIFSLRFRTWIVVAIAAAVLYVAGGQGEVASLIQRLVLGEELARFGFSTPTVSSATANAVDGRRLTIVDGDTVRWNGQRVRFLGIDAPEISQPRCQNEAEYGRRATSRLAELLADATQVEIVDTGDVDKYGRILGNVLLDGQDAGELLVREGLALQWQPGRAAWERRRQHWCGF